MRRIIMTEKIMEISIAKKINIKFKINIMMCMRRIKNIIKNIVKKTKMFNMFKKTRITNKFKKMTTT
jgi:hypothetical protein